MGIDGVQFPEFEISEEVVHRFMSNLVFMVAFRFLENGQHTLAFVSKLSEARMLQVVVLWEM